MEQNKEIRHYHHIGSDEELRSSYAFLRKMERSGQIKVLPKLFEEACAKVAVAEVAKDAAYKRFQSANDALIDFEGYQF